MISNLKKQIEGKKLPPLLPPPSAYLLPPVFSSPHLPLPLLLLSFFFFTFSIFCREHLFFDDDPLESILNFLFVFFFLFPSFYVLFPIRFSYFYIPIILRFLFLIYLMGSLSWYTKVFSSRYLLPILLNPLK